MKKQITTLNFRGQKIYVGIDVHKKSWKVTIMLESIEHKTFSQDPCAKLLGNYLRKHFPNGEYISAYEAGFCGFSIHRKLIIEGINNIIVNPADIPVTDKEKRQKEDKRDSRKIARSLRSGELTGIHIPRIETEELRTLLKCRSDYVKDLNRNKNRIKSLLHIYGINIPSNLESGSKTFSKDYVLWLRNTDFQTNNGIYSLNQLVDYAEFLKAKLSGVTTKIRKEAKEGIFSGSIKLLRSVPGIGLITATHFITAIEEIERFATNDELCSYIGLVPSTNSSGDKDKTGSITPRANRKLRGLLVESAWIAARRDPALLLAFTKLCERMKPSKAIIRIAKKLTNRTRYVLKNKEPYKYALAA